jgi:hypothetical protein
MRRIEDIIGGALLAAALLLMPLAAFSTIDGGHGGRIASSPCRGSLSAACSRAA